MSINLKNYSLWALKNAVVDLGLEPYRANQIYQWMWQKGAKDFNAMTNISKDVRTLLADTFIIAGLQQEEAITGNDRTRKFLLKLEDNHRIEAVFIPEGKRKTVCISTQVGCPLGCRFCATALYGFKRNLEAHEIADQVRLIRDALNHKITNVVFMGMGEPLLNLPAVIESIETLSSPIGLAISQRHITISTVGLLDGIHHLLKMPLKVKLAISLNFTDEDMRSEMMPATRNHPLHELLRLAKAYSREKSMVTFEYVMIDTINDRIRDAKCLLKLLQGIPAKINLIPYNPYPALPYKQPSIKKIERFHDCLLSSRHTITLRKSRGQDVYAGCGQLAGNARLGSTKNGIQ